jgi:hypothetical protein
MMMKKKKLVGYESPNNSSLHPEQGYWKERNKSYSRGSNLQ